jgi:hypothetical protein
VKRSATGTCGTFAELADTISTPWWSTLLCSTFARSASGVVSLPGCGNTAVPSTRGRSRSYTSSTNSLSEPSCFLRFAATISRPRRQVLMRVNTSTAMSSGSQPPCATFDRLAARKVASTPPKATAARASFHGGHFHSTRATASSSSVSTTSAPVTDTP